MPKDEELLTEIRENFDYAMDSTREIREESKHDMACVAGDPWDPAERTRREDPKNPRPCLTFDLLAQFLNQLINDVRDQKRAIKVEPIGAGATDKTAELRGNRIRQIEYESNAQAAYITAFENAVSRSYGAFRIKTKYLAPDSFEQKIVVGRIANPDTVWWDPDFKEADASDINWCFVTDLVDEKKFRKEFKSATVTSFTTEMMNNYPHWVHDKKIQIAEYWKREMEDYELGLLATGESIDTEKLVGGDEKPVRTKRAKRNKIKQYITNGVEILESTDWPGKYIPIFLVFGKEIWVDDGSGSKRVLESLIRKAREPFMAYCWARSTEAEIIRMSPKTPWMAYKGQFENMEEVAQSLNDTPRAYVEVNPVTDATGAQVLPLPTRQPYDPPVQSLEIFCEACIRAVQAAMGIQPLPTAAQRQNEKSGVALQRIQTQTQKGSFHFVDNYERTLEHAGRAMNDLLDKVEDTQMERPVRSLTGDSQMQMIGPEDYGKGEHDVTISTGPSFESERDQADQFVESILQVIPTLPIPQPAQAMLLAKAIKLKNLGPIGDEIVDIIAPPQNENLPPQAQAALQQLQGQLQQAQHAVVMLQQEKEAKVLENQTKLSVADKDNATKIAIAEIQTKAQSEIERRLMFKEIWQEIHGAAHDAGLQAQEQAHERDMAEQQQAAAQQQQASQQGHEQQMAEQQQEEPATVGA